MNLSDINHYNDDSKDKFFDANDLDTFDIDNEPPDTLQSFTTNLRVAYESKQQQKACIQF